MPLSTSMLPRTEQSLAARRRPERRDPDEALDSATVAELPAKRISQMTESELHRVIRAARIPAASTRLKYLDRATKERLAHLACLSCRNRNT